MILAAVLLLLLIVKVRMQPKRIVAYGTDEGDVWVTRSAIIELVKTTCEQMPSVLKPTVKMRVKGRQTHFNIYFKLASNGQLKHIETTLQTQLRKALQDNFGLQNLGMINLIATGFKQQKIDFSNPITQAKYPHLSDGDASEIASNDALEAIEK